MSDYALHPAVTGIANSADYNENLQDLEDASLALSGGCVVSGGVATDGGGLVANLNASVYLIGIKLSKAATIVGLQANATNKIWAVVDPDDVERCVYDVVTDGSTPDRSALVSSIVTGPATITSIDNNPSGRRDLVDVGLLAEEVVAARGSAGSLDARLDVALQESGALKDASIGEGKLSFEPVRDRGRSATGHVRLLGQPNDGDTVTITVAGVARTYEFDNNAAVTGGNTSVTIGASAAQSTTNLRTAINTQQGAVLASAVHGSDANTVDLAVLVAGSTLALAESTAGARVVVQDNGEELAAADRYLVTQRRTVTAEDVSRGRIRIDTRLTTVINYQLRFRAAANDYAAVAYSGTVTVTGGVLELDDDGATDLAAGNIIELLAVGT